MQRVCLCLFCAGERDWEACPSSPACLSGRWDSDDENPHRPANLDAFGGGHRFHQPGSAEEPLIVLGSCTSRGRGAVLLCIARRRISAVILQGGKLYDVASDNYISDPYMFDI